MTTNVSPATKVERVEWTSLNLTQTPVQNDSGMVVYLTANISFATQEYLGDEAGEPVQVLRLNQKQVGRYIDREQILSAEFFGEEVTLGDGKKLTLMELLSQKLASASTFPAIPSTVAP